MNKNLNKPHIITIDETIERPYISTVKPPDIAYEEKVMLYLIADEYDSLYTATELTEDILQQHKEGGLDIFRALALSSTVTGYEMLNNGEWEVIE